MTSLSSLAMFKKFGLPFLSGMFILAAPIFVSNASVTGRHQTTSSSLNRESKPRIVPRCAHRIPKYHRIGWTIKFAVPKGARVRKITDVDYQEYLVRTSKGVKPLQLWWGVNMSAGMAEQTEQTGPKVDQFPTVDDSRLHRRRKRKRFAGAKGRSEVLEDF